MTRRSLLRVVACLGALLFGPKTTLAAPPVPLVGLTYGPLQRLVNPVWKVVPLPTGATSVQLWATDRVTGEAVGNAVRLEPGYEGHEVRARALLNLWAEEEDHRLVTGHDTETCHGGGCPWASP